MKKWQREKKHGHLKSQRLRQVILQDTHQWLHQQIRVLFFRLNNMMPIKQSVASSNRRKIYKVLEKNGDKNAVDRFTDSYRVFKRTGR